MALAAAALARRGGCVYLGSSTSTGTLDLHTWTDFVAIDTDGEVGTAAVKGQVKRGVWERGDCEMTASYQEMVTIDFEAESVGLIASTHSRSTRTTCPPPTG